MVEQRGIEPLTSALRTRRSAKLSYCPTANENTVSGFRFQVESELGTGSFEPVPGLTDSRTFLRDFRQSPYRMSKSRIVVLRLLFAVVFSPSSSPRAQQPSAAENRTEAVRRAQSLASKPKWLHLRLPMNSGAARYFN